MVRPAEDADVDVALQRIRDAHEVAGHPIRSVALYYLNQGESPAL
jgi:hypothetical protein